MGKVFVRHCLLQLSWLFINIIIVHHISKMAVAKILAPTLVLLLCILLVRKWCDIVERNYICNQGFRQSDVLITLSKLEKVSVGFEALHRWTRGGRSSKRHVGTSFLAQILLLLGGDIELNPGDRGLSCKLCSKLVKRGNRSIQCSECNGLCHLACYQTMDERCKDLIKSSYAWICPQCDKPNFFQGNSNIEEDYSCRNRYSPLRFAMPTQDIVQSISKTTKNSINAKERRSQPKRTKLTCLVINCRSLKNRVADLAAIMSEYQPDIVIGNESWLNQNIASSEIFPENYNVFRKDRIDGYGGVFQAVKKDLIITLRSDFDTECEILWTHCRMAGAKTKSFLFGAFYRSNSSDMESLIELDKSLFALGNKLQRQNVILGGDFNAPNIDWKTHHITGNVSTSEKLLEIIDKHDLCQMVMEPTRRQLSTNNVLDLVFSNNSNIVSSIKTIPGISDHDIVHFTLNVRCKRKRNVKRKIYIRKKADQTRIRQELQTFAQNFDNVTQGKSVEAKWELFESTMQNIINNCIPHKLSSSRYNLPWFTRSLRRQTRKKQKLYNKAKASGNESAWAKFREAKRSLSRRNLKAAT